MYAIGYIIYGIPNSEKLMDSLGDDPEDQLEDLGFEFRYSGSGGLTPGWCGVVLDRIDECNNLLISDLVLSPSEEQKQETENKVNSLPEHIRQIADPVNVYLIWGTS